MKDTRAALKIKVLLEVREDGGLRAWSDDVPGFVLSHSDPDAVIADVPHALAGILSARLDGDVTVDLLVGVASYLDGAAPDGEGSKEYVALCA